MHRRVLQRARLLPARWRTDWQPIDLRFHAPKGRCDDQRNQVSGAHITVCGRLGNCFLSLEGGHHTFSFGLPAGPEVSTDDSATLVDNGLYAPAADFLPRADRIPLSSATRRLQHLPRRRTAETNSFTFAISSDLSVVDEKTFVHLPDSATCRPPPNRLEAFLRVGRAVLAKPLKLGRHLGFGDQTLLTM